MSACLSASNVSRKAATSSCGSLRMNPTVSVRMKAGPPPLTRRDAGSSVTKNRSAAGGEGPASARPPRADAAARALEVAPLPHEPRQRVRELGELDLELALARARPLGKDVEDQRGPVDDLDAERIGHVALV